MKTSIFSRNPLEKIQRRLRLSYLLAIGGLLIAGSVLSIPLFQKQAEASDATVRSTDIYLSSASLPAIEHRQDLPQRPGSVPEKMGKPASQLQTHLPSFTALGVHWTEGDEALEFLIRFQADGKWSEWRTSSRDEDLDAKDGVESSINKGSIVFVPQGQATGFEYRLLGDASKTPRSVRFVTIDSSRGPTLKKTGLEGAISSLTQKIVPSVEAADLRIYSRAEWGADESLMYWDPEYRPIQKFVVHHTAGSNSVTDPMATMRGIYYYHAVTNDWGDIGYNYVVDPAGNIFAGRYGGDGAVGAHALGWNYGTMGISVMGTYTSTPVSAAAQSSVQTLIGKKARPFNVVPDAWSVMQGVNLPNVIGHRDVYSTGCPGDGIHTQLANIRGAARSVFDAEIVPAIAYSGFNHGQGTATVDAASTTTTWAEINNVGSATWYNFTSDQITVGTYPKDRVSEFSGPTWSGSTAARLSTSEVKPGQRARFNVVLTPPQRLGTFSEQFALYDRGTLIPDTMWTVAVTVTSSFNAELVSISPEGPQTYLVGETKTFTIKYKNLSSIAWISNTGSSTGYVALGTINPHNRSSIFADSSWFLNGTRSTRPEEARVNPGEVGTFTFTIKVPTQLGTYTEKFQLVSEYVAWIPGSIIALPITVTNGYLGEVVSIDPAGPISMLTGETKSITVTIKNIGTKPWVANTGSSTGYVAVGTSAPENRLSSFADGTWFMNGARPTRIDNTQTNPGQNGIFTFNLKAGNATGTVTEKFKLVSEHVSWIQGTEFEIPISVSTGFAGELVSIDPAGPISLLAGETKSVTVTMKNTGVKPWIANTGASTGYVAVGTSAPENRSSTFSDGTWFMNGARATRLDVTQTNPGENGIFTFNLKAGNTLGTYTEQFKLVSEYVAWISGTEFSLPITISNGFSGELVSIDPSAPLTILRGTTQMITVKMKNTNVRPWIANTGTATGSVFLGTALPENRSSLFADSTWTMNGARAARMTPAQVNTGETATFTFPLKAPQHPGIYTESFKVVSEYVSWIAGTQITIPIRVDSGYSGSVVSIEPAGPITLQTGETKDITVKIKNTNVATWTSTGTSGSVAIGTSSPRNRISPFSDATWAVAGTRPTKVDNAPVAPNSEGIFTFTVKAPYTPGSYTENYEAVAEYVDWMLGTPFSISFTVLQGYSGEIVSISPADPIVMTPGETKTVSVVMKNTNSGTWTTAGINSGYAAIGTAQPENRSSVFADASWFGTGSRATRLDSPSSVGLNGTGTYIFTIKAPATLGTYTEKFKLVVEYVAWVHGTEFSLPITVIQGYEGQVVSISPTAPITLAPGATTSVTITMKNTGIRPWIADTGTTQGYIALGTVNPHNRTSLFADSTWFMSGARPTRLDTPTVQPGENGVFIFTVKAPTIPGTYTEQFQAVSELVTWIAGTSVTIPFIVQ